MRKVMDLSGSWEVCLPDGTRAPARLPGTLDENGIGGPDRPEKLWNDGAGAGEAEDDAFGENPIHTRFTRLHTYTGPAVFTRTVNWTEGPEKNRIILTVERGRKLRLWVNGQEAAPLLPGTLNTPWRFETRAIRAGENEIRIESDNSYPGWPAEAILYSSAATDETQTNWNGLLGELTLEEKPEVFLLDARMVFGETPAEAELRAEISVPAARAGKQACLQIRCDALREGNAALSFRMEEGVQELRFRVPLREDLRRWNPEDPFRYDAALSLRTEEKDAENCRDEWETKFGFRVFAPDERRRISLNGRRILIRSEANCAEWPETGHPPMDAEAWERVIRLYQSYGVNCLRFHSHCPPEAAFEAADRLGMMMQPELSHWDPKHAFESNESFAYYRAELTETLRMLGKHPSFVMLTLGNELWCDETGVDRMEFLLREAKALLPDRMYAWGSNAFYGTRGCDEESDFYTAQKYKGYQMRAISAGGDSEHPTRKARIKGYLNNEYPHGKTNYSEGMAALREQHTQPMFSFEVGQYEVLPDFHELEQFHGVSDPINYKLIRNRAEKRGMMPLWDRMVAATGELALIGYREEVQAVMRTTEMSGISLLSLQDFPGQGTALVGMLNAHLQPKAYDFARPDRFRAFFRDCLPLPEVEKYTYTAGETLRFSVRAVNYGTEPLRGTLRIVLRDPRGETLAETEIPGFDAPAGEADRMVPAELTLPRCGEPVSAQLDLFLEEAPERFRNTVRLWIYPEEEAENPGDVLCADRLTAENLFQLEQGARLLLEPESTEACFPGGIRGQFSTDFWSVGTFPQQEGGMGLLIEEKHPLFRRFPTSFHTDYQWWLMAGQRSLRLPDESLGGAVIVRQMDSYSQLRSLAMLMEFRVGKGKILISSMGLKDLPQKPEVKALRNAILKYMNSADFAPKTGISVSDLKELLPGCLA